ncbi:glutamate racemase [Microaerobacter geothermalis]|uniref:glutamate racemase n=1 Tax=Microaerobacter geothermalis TaxID=674972 RepID=UPI001F2AE0C9|nr:glutamate racemase [Microaerobacter geothermalis]MCF6092628.1 glutamate racemase [Microaerobacter geothermalis]
MSQGIGVLDSGLGGLTVVKEIMKQLPGERIVYFGDTARCPYGPRPPQEVKRFTLEIVRYLLEFDIKMLVIACNTATAHALEDIKQDVDIPVIGVIRPGARAAEQTTKNGMVGVIGTEGTINSKAYERALKEINSNLNVIQLACPLFVSLVEKGQLTGSQALNIVAETLRPIRDKHLDTLILGCTHYPLIAPLIQEVMGNQVTLISSAEETVKEVKELLKEKQLLSFEEFTNSHLFYTSGPVVHFKKMAEAWLEMRVHVRSTVFRVS